MNEALYRIRRETPAIFNRLSVILWLALPLSHETTHDSSEQSRIPGSRSKAASTLTSEAGQHSSSQLFLCFTLNHHWLKHARPIPGFGASSMTSCIVSAVFAGCSLLLFWSPPYLHELHKQPTYLTHVLNFSQGKYWKLTAATTTPFLDLLSDEDKKGTEEGPLQDRMLCIFPPPVFTYFRISFKFTCDIFAFQLSRNQ